MQLEVELEPRGALDAAPRVLRARARVVPEGALDPDRLLLFQGEIGPAHLRQIARNEMSKALAERMVPALVFRDDAAASGASVGVELGDAEKSPTFVLAPAVALSLGETYSIASGAPQGSVELTIAEDDEAPFFERVWPPAGQAATAALGVWCPVSGPGVDGIDERIRLEPGGPAGRLTALPGAQAGGSCIRFDADPGFEPPAGGIWAPPPVAYASTRLVRLDPRPFAIEAPEAATTPVEAALPCKEGEVPFGPGCARILDDRALVRPPAVPLLWAVYGAGIAHVATTRPGEPFVVRPLVPSSAVHLSVLAIDVAGTSTAAELDVTTLAPMPHVVLNEVVADPLGPEPAQEWVEIVNDGVVAAELDGYVFSDAAGETPLPAAVLEPGAFAIVADETFDETVEPVPAVGALVLRVPQLGKNGLANSGEPLVLRDAEGAIVSTFPALPKPKPGLAVARVSPGAPDAPASFVHAPPSPGRENPPATHRGPMSSSP